jgi:hypothetical protein
MNIKAGIKIVGIVPIVGGKYKNMLVREIA